MADEIKAVAPEFYRELLAADVNMLAKDVYVIETQPGEQLFDSGRLDPSFVDTLSIQDAGYSTFPLILVTRGRFEVYLDNNRAKGYSGLSSIPIRLANSGDILGVFETCDAMLNLRKSVVPTKPWSVFCGYRTCIISNYQRKPFLKGLDKFKIPFKTTNENKHNHSNVLYSIFKNANLGVAMDTTSKVLVFSNSVVESIFNNNSQLAHSLLKLAWYQSKQIRDYQILSVSCDKFQKLYHQHTSNKLQPEAVEFIKNIIMAGNGLFPVFVRVNCPLESALEELLCGVVSNSIVFVPEKLTEKSQFEYGYLPLRYHFSRTEDDFFKAPQGENTYKKKMSSIASAFNLLEEGEFGINTKFRVEFFYKDDGRGGDVPNELKDSSDVLFSDVHFKEKLSEDDDSQSKRLLDYNLNDEFTYAFVKVTRLNEKEV